MKGITGLFLGIFGTFLFSWAGLIFIPNLQIGHQEPQMDEEGTDVYPAPKSGMAERGRRVYVANGCIYCHSQQVRADYAASDIERKWGERRSAPRDYLFDRPAMLGKMRMGPDLSNIGKRAPLEDANAPQATPPGASPAAAVAPAATTAAAPAASASPAAAVAAASPAAATKPGSLPSPAPSGAPGVAQPPGAATAQATTAAPAATADPATGAATSSDATTGLDGKPIPYTAAWHHRHLFSPRSVNSDSNMPSYAFLYDKRKVDGQYATDALTLSGADAPGESMEIVPTYDAKCLVAYLMSLDQSHALKEVKSVTAPSPPAPAKGVK